MKDDEIRLYRQSVSQHLLYIPMKRIYSTGMVFRNDYIMGFHEYTYQDREYIIKVMSTKHSQCTCYTFSW